MSSVQIHCQHDVIKIDNIASPNDVTTALLTLIINAHYKKNVHSKDDIQVTSFQWQSLGRGVMSNVQLLNVFYESDYYSKPTGGSSVHDNDNGISNKTPHDMPVQFLAKFRKAEIPLEDLFSVEGQFYQLVSELHPPCKPADATANPFPFRLVNAIATGTSWLLLEYIPLKNIDIIDVHQGCPPDRFDDLLVRLARMHATCWVANTSSSEETATTASASSTGTTSNLRSLIKKHAPKLSQTPGAGHSLPISARQEQFLPGWLEVRKRLIPYFTSNNGQQLDQIVSQTATRIEEITQSVADKKYTLVHGDFHIGNTLTTSNNDGDGDDDIMEQHSMPWLVDWSMAGIGNPCVDLVFFLVVGAGSIPIYENNPSLSDGTTSCESSNTNATTAGSVGLILKQYHQVLTAEAPLLSWESFQEMFRQCLLNQFIILVCYDGLCRNMADASPSESSQKMYHDHFDRVNVRCARMLLTEYGILGTN